MGCFSRWLRTPPRAPWERINHLSFPAERWEPAKGFAEGPEKPPRQRWDACRRALQESQKVASHTHTHTYIAVCDSLWGCHDNDSLLLLRRKAGLSTGLTLQGSVHPELAQSGDLVRLRASARCSAPFRNARLTSALYGFCFFSSRRPSKPSSSSGSSWRKC